MIELLTSKKYMLKIKSGRDRSTLIRNSESINTPAPGIAFGIFVITLTM